MSNSGVVWNSSKLEEDAGSNEDDGDGTIQASHKCLEKSIKGGERKCAFKTIMNIRFCAESK